LIDLSDFNETQERRELIDDIAHTLLKFHDYGEDSPIKLSWFFRHLHYDTDYNLTAKKQLFDELTSLDDPNKDVFVKVGHRDWQKDNE
jgi:hypothetical protein